MCLIIAAKEQAQRAEEERRVAEEEAARLEKEQKAKYFKENQLQLSKNAVDSYFSVRKC